MGYRGTLLPALVTMLLALVVGTKQNRSNKTVELSALTSDARSHSEHRRSKVVELPEVATTLDPGHLHTPSFMQAGDQFSSLQNFNNTNQEKSPYGDDIQMGCKELRSKKYISDGPCTSIKPVMEMICAGYCLPIDKLPWYAEFVKYWARTKILEWRCVEERIRRKDVQLLCEDGSIRHYNIKVVKSCTCKRYHPNQNRSYNQFSRATKPRRTKKTKKHGRRSKPRRNRKNKNVKKTN